MEARGDHSRGHTSEGSYPVPWVQWSHHYTPCSVGPPPCRPPAVCVRWMERRGNHRGRGRGHWCGREGGRDNATHSQPLRSGVGEGEGAGEVCAVHTHPALM